MPHQITYTRAERAVVRQLYPTAPRAELLAALPTRNWRSIKDAASRLKIRRPHPQNWSPDHLELLRAHYPAEGAIVVARLTGRPVGSCYDKAHQEGITYLGKRGTKPASSRPPRVLSPEEQAAKAAATHARIQAKAARRRARDAARAEDTKTAQAEATKRAALAAKVAAKFATLAAKKAARVKATLPSPPQPMSPSTPNLNLQKAVTKQKAAPRIVPVTAAEIKALGPNHPARWAYTVAVRNGPEAAWQAFHQAMQLAKKVV